MKKLFYLVAAVGLLFTACSEYDDTDILNRVGSLEERVADLEETVAALNQDIAGVKTLVEAMQNNVYVSKIVEGETGYEVYFTNGEMISIADGKAGENGKDGNTVTIVLEDGEYYWAVIENGTTTFLTDDQGNKLPVKGDAPLMRVTMEGETGYWEVSYDNGQSWERILLEDGTPVTTSGGGGGLFKEVYEDTENNKVVFVFLNGDTLEIELRGDLYMNFKKEITNLVVEFGKSATVELEAVGVLKTVVTTPDEWKAAYKEGVLTVTAPAAEHASCADLSGEVSVIYFGSENQSSVVTVPVCAGVPVEADAKGGEVVVDYTFEGEVTVESEAAWVTAAVAEGVVTLTVEQNVGVTREGVVYVKAADYTLALVVKQKQEVELLAYGYRTGSETVQFAKPLSEITGLTAASASHVAVTGKYVIVAAAGEAPAVLDALTGEYVQALDLGELAGLNAAITTDSEGNIVVSTFAEATGFRIGRMKDINDTLEVFITRDSAEYGKDLSVVGDVYGDARVTLMYSPWTTGTTGHLLYVISGGVADAGTWSKIAAGDITDKIDNNNGDVIYRDMGEGAPYFMSGYSSNCFVWAEGGTAQAIQVTTNGNCGAVCLDVAEFNNAKYLMTACDTYFTWSLPDAGMYFADVTTLESFKAGVVFIPTGEGAYGWNAASTGGNTDCALYASEDGVYMYAYVLHPNGSLGCIRVDCLAE